MFSEMPLILEAFFYLVIAVYAWVSALKEVEPKARPQAVVKTALSTTVRPFALCLIILLCHGVALLIFAL
ncbi:MULTISPECIES: hypothetical protein [unclassified Vibrio]|uniref:hypothetical protein n=1 Tax=unclassified Vibrio TaxID=2614977 RepID=UPI00355350B1